MHCHTLYAWTNFILTKGKVIDKMALLCSSIPLFNALSDLLTDAKRYSNNHFIERTTIDPFFRLLCAGTGDEVSEFIQRTANTL
jgi:hypothetical protein